MESKDIHQVVSGVFCNADVNGKPEIAEVSDFGAIVSKCHFHPVRRTYSQVAIVVHSLATNTHLQLAKGTQHMTAKLDSPLAD